jgi:hypothetical protein
MTDRPALERELEQLSAAARERRSVDAFMRAAVEGFCWVVLAGVCGKLCWDSARPPPFFWPLALLDLMLLWDALRSYAAARAHLRRELLLEARVRELRRELGVDAPVLPPRALETGS